jgi:glutamyl-tRNA synthetase
MKTLEPAHVARHLAWHLGELGVDPADGPPLEAIVQAQAERTRTLVEMARNSLFFYHDPDGYDDKAAKKNFKAGAEAVLAALLERLGELEDWQPEAIHHSVLAVAEDMDLKLGKVAQPLRVAVSGGPVSPPIDQTLALLGRERTLRRIEAAENWIRENVLEPGGEA